MRKWIGKKLWRFIRSLYEIRWRQSPISGDLEIQVVLAGTNILMLRARPNMSGDNFTFEEII